MIIDNKNAVKYEWKLHPLKANWKISVILIMFLVGLCAFIYISFDSFAFLILSVAFLFGSLSSFFLPTTYIIQENCIIVKSLFRKQSKEWNTFKKYYPDKNGVFLSPFSYRTRLENFRGLYIRLGDNRDDALNFIKQKIDYNEEDTKE